MNGPSQTIWTGDDLSDREFAAIAELMRNAGKIDLEQYKDRCIRRRIARRLRACMVPDVDAYLALLRSDPQELETLEETLSIHVSQFFRNPETYRVLEQKILPDLFRRARQAGRRHLTLWSAGCAAGEEPYSLALLVDDLAAADFAVRILATDISQPVLDAGRAAIFPVERLKELPTAVLADYFQEQADGSYRLIDRIRDMVCFEQYNILVDEPYPEVDLIFCRNVLIYFTREEQERILGRFAVALAEDGVLVLGRSETLIGDLRQSFHAEFPVERIYRRTRHAAKGAGG